MQANWTKYTCIIQLLFLNQTPTCVIGVWVKSEGHKTNTIKTRVQTYTTSPHSTTNTIGRTYETIKNNGQTSTSKTHNKNRKNSNSQTNLCSSFIIHPWLQHKFQYNNLEVGKSARTCKNKPYRMMPTIGGTSNVCEFEYIHTYL